MEDKLFFMNEYDKNKLKEERMRNSTLAHYKNKKLLKILGFVFLIIGIILALIGLISFGISFNNMSMPNFFTFFLLFPGFILIGIGTILLRFGYMKEVGGYIKNESIPIINEASEEIKPTIKILKMQ